MNETLYPPFGILLVDDEPAWLLSLSITLERCAGITNITTCEDSRDVMGILGARDVGIVLLDLTMPGPSGEELLARITEEHPGVIVIIISGMNQLETAVRCMQAGAFDYFVKTAEEDRIVSGVLRAVRMLELQRENREMSKRLLSGTLHHPKAFVDIVTADHAMHAIFSYIEAVAKSSEPLLISGESGVGKEFIAKAAHNLSGCRGPLVAVNVAGLDDTVFADTLFGHVRGAFTGADQARRGMIEEATDGTLFLDEIGDLSIASQVKLLRLLQEGEYFPLGSDRPKRLKARVIFATHQDLATKQTAGTFRRDLYYRLCTHHVQVPPLRERKGDLPLLLDHFLGEAAQSTGQKEADAAKGAGAAACHLQLSRQRARAESDGIQRRQHPHGADSFHGIISQNHRPFRRERCSSGHHLYPLHAGRTHPASHFRRSGGGSGRRGADPGQRQPDHRRPAARHHPIRTQQAPQDGPAVGLYMNPEPQSVHTVSDRPGRGDTGLPDGRGRHRLADVRSDR